MHCAILQCRQVGVPCIYICFRWNAKLTDFFAFCICLSVAFLTSNGAWLVVRQVEVCSKAMKLSYWKTFLLLVRTNPKSN